MNALAFVLLALLTGQTGAGRMAALAANKLPRSDHTIRVEEPVAAVCRDGATWLFWWQGVSFSHYRDPGIDSERPIPADYGIFGRLIAPDGKDIVTPRRLIAPATWNHALRDLWPEINSAEPTPDGGALLFVRGGAERFDAPTLLFGIDRTGATGTAPLNVVLNGDHRGMNGLRLAGNLQSCWCGDGRLRCLTYSGHSLSQWSSDSFEYAYLTVGVRHGRPEVVKDKRMKFYNEYQGRSYVRTPPSPLDYVRRAVSGDCHWGMAEAAPDTLVIVRAPPTGEWDRIWGDQFAGDTLVVYRVRSEDLGLIDSLRVQGDTVVGTVFSGPHLPRAVVQRTSKDLIFALPALEGNAVYHFDRECRPVSGVRETRAALLADSCPAPVYQAVSFGRSTYELLQVDWFGFTDDGVLCSDGISGLDQDR
jgi:hypothetical protein